MTQENNTDLDVLLPEPVLVEAGGEKVEVTHLKVAQIPKIVRCADPVLRQLHQGVDPLAIIGMNGEAVIALVAFATGKDQEWVGKLDAHEFIDLFVAVIEVNSGFFVRVLLPRIEAAASRIETTFGGLQLPGLSDTGIASPT